MKNYDRTVRLGEIKSSVNSERKIYALGEFAKEAQSRFPLKKEKACIVYDVIRDLTVSPHEFFTGKHKIFINLLNVLTPQYYNNVYISRRPATLENPALISIMVHLWQALEANMNGYPLEMEVAKAVRDIANMILIEEGELSLCPKNQKSTQENKSLNP